ncbi:universal stress protein [Shewanella sp.]|uniref:universal stress protein n=1 Tax=Shewanella sp. TaxID=50422 RepID=UPI003A96F944
MLGSKILVGYDGAELSNRALQTALTQLRDHPQITVDVLYVEEVAKLSNGVEVLDDNVQQHNDSLFTQLQHKVQDSSARVHLHRLSGQNTSYVLLRFAEEHNNDLIIVGSRGLTGIREFLGSVSHAVVQHSLVPVLIVK